jgi:hypothetical protein
MDGLFDSVCGKNLVAAHPLAGFEVVPQEVDVSPLSVYHLTGLDPQWSRCGRLFATPLPFSPHPPTGRRFRANGSHILYAADANSKVFLEVTCATLGESWSEDASR